jgi:hypothetical protein
MLSMLVELVATSELNWFVALTQVDPHLPLGPDLIHHLRHPPRRPPLWASCLLSQTTLSLSLIALEDVTPFSRLSLQLWPRICIFPACSGDEVLPEDFMECAYARGLEELVVPARKPEDQRLVLFFERAWLF